MPSAAVLVALLSATFFWGSSFAIAKYALRQLQPLALASLRFLVAGLLYACVLFVLRRKLPPIQRGDWKVLAGLSILGVSSYFWVQYTAVSLTTATNASLIIATSPLLVALFTALIRRETMARAKWVGIFLSYAGVLLIVTGNSQGTWWQAGSQTGNLLMLLNACCWAIFTLLGRQITQRYPPFVVTAWIGIFGGLGLLPLGLMKGMVEALPTLTWETWLAVLYLAVPCTILGYGGWYYALSKIEASRTAPFQYLQPLYTVGLAAILLGEMPSWNAVLGGALIIGGLLWANRPALPVRVAVACAPPRST